jgi:hypothetical protein
LQFFTNKPTLLLSVALKLFYFILDPSEARQLTSRTPMTSRAEPIPSTSRTEPIPSTSRTEPTSRTEQPIKPDTPEPTGSNHDHPDGGKLKLSVVLNHYFEGECLHV